MKNFTKVISKTLLTAMLAFTSQASLATILTVEVADQAYQVGDLVTADIVISDIEQLAGNQVEVASFSLDFLFDSNEVTNAQVTFGNLLDLGVIGSSQSDVNNGDSLTIDEVSLESPFDLFFEQSLVSSFVLASVQFELASAGTVDFSLANVSLTDGFGTSGVFAPASLDLRGASFAVSSAQVPLPASAALMLLPLLFLVRKRDS
ncbi:hypothetical protein [Thalassotalea euphylliae]|uniref:Cohesin domain-containing protein n=1 Tax=Thalassotalea euphylliae TaxID=1655234 RepID=A0A3E0TZI8_9GAMM|nr:hypothetical protein [Thalassotalea euphylliae]REL29272.1 hypothetical protein DXX94_00170 [Thalassotalea euphylliae]